MIHMRRSLVLICGLLMALAVPTTANAAISTVFNDATSPLSCTVQPTTNYRFCGATANTTVPSFDGTPIDVSVSFPADAGGSDNNFPLVGIFHGWAGSKILPSSTQTTRWLAQGYAVISVTDRGWGASCGGPSNTPKAPPCDHGHIHLMSNAAEVRDAQYLMGMLSDDGVIDGQKIAATGGSYGGAISAQLATLKNRTQLPDNTLVPWTSPIDGNDMSIAAALPEYTWSDLPQALMPNGSGFDYVADSPYLGPNGDRRVGVDKQYWNGQLYLGGAFAGYLAPTSGPGFPDPTANLKRWFELISTGGPYDGNAEVDAMLAELENNHSSYGVDDSVAPAPMLLSSGWNDDLFPVSEAVRLYNKVRTDNPATPVNLFGMDYGHAPRSNGPTVDAAAFGADFATLTATQNAWINYYVKGSGSAPANPFGGVTITTSKCSGTTRVAGDTTTASSWANLAVGEVTINGASAQTIVPGTNPASPFTSGTVCANSANSNNTAGAAVYESPVVSGGGYTLAGSPSVDATLTVNGANDQIVSRLYDVDTTVSPATEKLIARGVYRPVSVGHGPSRETFQLYPQAWKVNDGHKLKLELLSSDSQYMRPSQNTVQQPITVQDLTLHVPTPNDVGDANGAVGAQQPRTLAPGYSFTADALASDSTPPSTTDNVPATSPTPVSVTLSATDIGISGVDKTYYTVGTAPADPTTASAVYNPAAKPVLQNGEKIRYFSADRSGNTEASHTSAAAKVVPVIPAAPTPAVLVKLSLTVKIKGSVKVGKTVRLTLTTKASGTKVSSVKYTYKWTAGKKTVGRKSSLKLKKSWKGKRIKVVVTAKKSGYKTGSKTTTVTKKLK
jgi:fermentation-respiration switch protein FrsA (DUF1100 family)